MRELGVQIFWLGALILVLGVLPAKNPCNITEEVFFIKGDSLSGIFEDGEKIFAEKNYYACNPVQRGDLVLYSYAGAKNPIVKIVKGVPGDYFLVEPFQEKKHVLRINGLLLLNSKDELYVFDERRAGVLKMYFESYGGVIPEDSYLILGNLAKGSIDSTRFGLVHKSDFIGRVKK